MVARHIEGRLRAFSTYPMLGVDYRRLEWLPRLQYDWSCVVAAALHGGVRAFAT